MAFAGDVIYEIQPGTVTFNYQIFAR